jgi:hypothetical protein
MDEIAIRTGTRYVDSHEMGHLRSTLHYPEGSLHSTVRKGIFDIGGVPTEIMQMPGLISAATASEEAPCPQEQDPVGVDTYITPFLCQRARQLACSSCPTCIEWLSTYQAVETLSRGRVTPTSFQGPAVAVGSL